MLSRWLRFGLGKRVEVASRTAEELASLRSRFVRLDELAKSWAAAEAALRRRVAAQEAELKTTWERLLAVLERLAATERAFAAERDRAERAEAQALAGAAALAERERELEDMMAGRAELEGTLERERAVRLVAEEAARGQNERDAIVEQRLRGLGESVERGLAALREQFAEQRELIANLAGPLEQAIERLRPPLRLVPPRGTPEHPSGEAVPRAADAEDAHHLRFFATIAGYELVVADGAPPAPGAVVDVPGVGLRAVAKLAPSPLPDDKRRCAYLLPPAPVDPQDADGRLPEDGAGEDTVAIAPTG